MCLKGWIVEARSSFFLVVRAEARSASAQIIIDPLMLTGRYTPLSFTTVFEKNQSAKSSVASLCDLPSCFVAYHSFCTRPVPGSSHF